MNPDENQSVYAGVHPWFFPRKNTYNDNALSRDLSVRGIGLHFICICKTRELPPLLGSEIACKWNFFLFIRTRGERIFGLHIRQ